MKGAGTPSLRYGPLLYGEIRAGRNVGMVGPAASAAEQGQINNVVGRHGGEVRDTTAQRLTATFLRHQDALACAQDLRAMVHGLGAKQPAGSALGCRILLAHAVVTGRGSSEEAQ